MCWNDGQKEFLEYVSLARQCQLKETSLTAVQSRIEQIANQNPPSLEEWEFHSDQSNTKKKEETKNKEDNYSPGSITSRRAKGSTQ